MWSFRADSCGSDDGDYFPPPLLGKCAHDDEAGGSGTGIKALTDSQEVIVNELTGFRDDQVFFKEELIQ
jgi:hypothetical protein